MFCDAPLAQGPPWAPGPGHRLAFDPDRGRLWAVCPRCTRWNLTPLDLRWETLEACKEAVAKRGKGVLSTPHLTLVDVGEGELIQVGQAHRPEFVDWRYGPRLPGYRPGFWSRLIAGLPSPPLEGYDPYRGILSPPAAGVWLASPFLEVAAPLSYLFTQVPLAPRCPACARPLVLHPWEFQGLRFLSASPSLALLAPCAFCGTRVELGVGAARPTLRLALGVVTPPPVLRGKATEAARELGGVGGGEAFLASLSRDGTSLGEMDALARCALLIALDEMAEADALEAEWRVAEEMAAIMDGELTEVPGFEAFREQVLTEGP